MAIRAQNVEHGSLI